MKSPNTHERFGLWIEFKKRLSTSSPRPRQIAVFWERIDCEVLMGPKDHNHGDISTPSPDSSVAPGRVWRQTAEGWVGGHHVHIKSHYIIERLKAHSLLTLQGPGEAGATLYSRDPDGCRRREKKRSDLQSFFFFLTFFFFFLFTCEPGVSWKQIKFYSRLQFGRAPGWQRGKPLGHHRSSRGRQDLEFTSRGKKKIAKKRRKKKWANTSTSALS